MGSGSKWITRNNALFSNHIIHVKSAELCSGKGIEDSVEQHVNGELNIVFTVKPVFRDHPWETPTMVS